MKRLFLVGIALGLSGCAGFNLGAMTYCPYGQACNLTVMPVPGQHAVTKETKL